MFGFKKTPKDSKTAKPDNSIVSGNGDSKNSDISEKMSWKCERFFAKNWKYIFYFSIAVMLLISYEISSISSRMKKLEEVVANNNGKVVLTTTDGRAIKVTKEPLKAEYLKKFAVSTIVSSFINSRSQLTDNFKKPNYNNFSDVLNTVPALKTVLEEFIDSEDKQAVGDLRGYLQWLISAIAQDKLPEYISIKDYEIDKYEYVGNRFVVEVSIKVVAQSYILSQDRYVTAPGVIKVVAKGSFDLAKSTDINPYGLRFGSLEINTVTKPAVKNL